MNPKTFCCQKLFRKEPLRQFLDALLTAGVLVVFFYSLYKLLTLSGIL